MPHEIDKKKMSRETMLAKVEDVLKRGGEKDPPAYTLVLGAGASFGVVPTAKEMLGLPDTRKKTIHNKGIPLWLAGQGNPHAKFDSEPDRLECSREFWKKFRADNADNQKCNGIEYDPEGFPKMTSIAAAYQAVFDTACVGGLDTPERHRNYMRAVTMSAAPGSTQLNATHFYLASLLSLQKRAGELGSDKKLLYTGRREFARTIFTTNFDPLLQTSLQLFQLLYYMTDRPEYLSADALQTDSHPAMHLFYAHGSVHRPYMANTEEQITLLKKQNARDLAAYLGNHGVIVLGYSGWDDCLLEALNQTKIFSNNLYWLARGAQSISDKVAEFLANHSNAYWVEIDDGGNFMAELHTRLCPGAPNTEMLYNPIRPLLCQLGCVSLSGVQSGGDKKENDSEKEISVSDSPRDVEAIRLQVIARLEDAQKLFTEMAKAETNWEELERQASLSYSNHDWDAALSVYDRLLDQTPDLPVEYQARALVNRAYCHSEKGDIDKAIADYTAVIELVGAPVDQVAHARINRGVAYKRQGDMDKAITDYTAVIELAGAPVDQVAKAIFNRGVRYDEKGLSDEAIADYTAVIELSGAPVDLITKAGFNRALIYENKGDKDKAIADYTAIIELSGAPVDQVSKALINRAVIYNQQNDIDKAIADYTAVVELQGASVYIIARARVNRGVCFGQKGDVDKELADYTAVIELPGAPADQVAKARFNRAVTYRDRNDMNKATADFNAIIELAEAPMKIVESAKTELSALKSDSA